jgi:hypothetical protein
MLAFLSGLAGPIIWAAHFFAMYLAESVFCDPSALHAVAVRVAMIGLSTIAIAALLVVRWQIRGTTPPRPLAWTRPLIDLSIVAVLWTSLPIFIVNVCKPP